MKLAITILFSISFLTVAKETQVIFGQTKHVMNLGGVKESFVDSLNLNNCNINLSAPKKAGRKRISITFSNREFEAEGVRIKSNKDGSCTLLLVKGKGIK